MSSASVGELISNLCAVGIFEYMACYAIFRFLVSSDRVQMAGGIDVLIVLALCLLVLLPHGQMIWIAAAGVAVYLLICSRGDLSMRRAGIVLAALSVQQYWGHFIFELIAVPLLDAETAVVGTLLQLARAGTTWHDNIITTLSGHGINLYHFFIICPWRYFAG
jgi:hypothetical protein